MLSIKIKNYRKVCLVIGDVYNNKLIENDAIYIYWNYCNYNYKQNNMITNMLNKKKSQQQK